MTVRVIQGDCLEVMPTLDAESIDAIVSDPPYGLGFMGKAWDHGVPGVPFWVEAIRVAKPGAYLLAFGGTRTFHRLTVAIEDAGWEIRDCLSWLYGSGFPKSLNIGEGRGTALKPAWEPIILARKPFKQTVAANVQEHGTAALNIDACRIGAESIATHSVPQFRSVKKGADGRTNDGRDGDNWTRYLSAQSSTGSHIGRWPANVCLDEEAAAMLDEQSGESTSSGGRSGHTGAYGGGYKMEHYGGRTPGLGDTGGASRFFYTAKAGRSEREEGLQGLAIRTHGQSNGAKAAIARGEEYQAADNGLNRTKRVANHHPTVKPLDLMRWLVRLVTPPNGVVLDPFMGSGTTGIAAVLESKRFIGIEKEAEYCAIAEKRIAHWGAQGILNLDGVA